MTIDGLNKYNYTDLAKTIATSWVSTNVRIFNDTGKLMEKYNVVDTGVKAGGGEYPPTGWFWMDKWRFVKFA